jgi:acetolactate decarboxylase
MPTLTCDIPDALSAALAQRQQTTGEDTTRFVTRALRSALGLTVHTLFQVSTSRALVQGVYGEVVLSSRLLSHGDFGLGTFDELDGEMVLLDGVIYQVRSDGSVRRVDESTGTPFATVLTFAADEDLTLERVDNFAHLCRLCDTHRGSDNLFYAFRVDGEFDHVHTRAMRRTDSGVSLRKAASTQPEFHFQKVRGTLVGFWSPTFAGAVDIPGYHFHFLSDDRTMGGHVLDCAGSNLRLRVQKINEFHLSLPDTEEFLRADLKLDLSQDLRAAEGDHSQEKS